MIKSSALWRDGIGHRLRLSGLPTALEPWVARILWDLPEYSLESRFIDLWETGFPHPLIWRSLNGIVSWPLRAGPAKRIDPGLAQSLQAAQPPLALTRFDPGDEHGPVIGTIHASKGREANRVHLMLPQERSGHAAQDDPDGESRVCSWARHGRNTACYRQGQALVFRKLKSGRVYISVNATACLCEMGRPDDFKWLSSTDRHRISDRIAAGARLRIAMDENVMVVTSGEHVLGNAGPVLLDDLRQIRHALSGAADYRPVKVAPIELYCIGLRTIVGDTGFALAPIASGMVKTLFPIEAAR